MRPSINIGQGVDHNRTNGDLSIESDSRILGGKHAEHGSLTGVTKKMPPFELSQTVSVAPTHIAMKKKVITHIEKVPKFAISPRPARHPAPSYRVPKYPSPVSKHLVVSTFLSAGVTRPMTNARNSHSLRGSPWEQGRTHTHAQTWTRSWTLDPLGSSPCIWCAPPRARTYRPR